METISMFLYSDFDVKFEVVGFEINGKPVREKIIRKLRKLQAEDPR